MLSKDFDIEGCKIDIINIMSKHPTSRWGLETVRKGLVKKGYELTNQQIGFICKRMQSEGILIRFKTGEHGRTIIKLSKEYVIL